MILCAGEALIDMIPTATVTGQTGYVPHVGGSVLNTAVALGRLGAPVALLTGLSSDRFGQRIEAALAASHVSTEPSLRSARPTIPPAGPCIRPFPRRSTPVRADQRPTSTPS